MHDPNSNSAKVYDREFKTDCDVPPSRSSLCCLSTSSRFAQDLGDCSDAGCQTTLSQVTSYQESREEITVPLATGNFVSSTCLLAARCGAGYSSLSQAARPFQECLIAVSPRQDSLS